MADTSSKSNPSTSNLNTPQGRIAAAQKAVQENQAAGLRQGALAGQGGGRGVVGGKYGVQITDKSAVGGREGTRTNQANVPDWNSKESEFIASLKTNAGIVAPSTIAEARDPNNPYNKAISDWERGNNLIRDKAAQDQALSEAYFASQHPTSDKAARQIFNPKPTSYDQNYGYSQNIKPSDIITKGFSKNPTDVTFTVTPAGQRQIDFYQASKGTNYGGVETQQSKGKSYGSEWTSKQSQSIGEKIFSNQPTLVRNSPFENKVKTKEAERASQVYPSFANKDYATGGKKEEAPVVTLGKAQGFFGNKTTFGWEDVSKDQLVRGSTKEKLATSGIGVLSTPASQFGTAFETKGGLVDKNAKGGVVFQTVKSGQGTVTVLKQPEAQQPTNTNTLTDKDFRNLLTTEENQGAVFSIFAGGKKVSETSGPRAYHDYLAAQKQYGNNVLISATYPETEKNIISNVRKNPDFYAKQPSSYWQNLGEKGYLTSKGMSQVNLILRQNWFKETQPIREQDKAFRQNLSDITNAGLGFNIKDKSGNVVATTQGPRAYHDYLATQKQYGKDVTIEPKYEWSIGDYFNKTLLAQPKSTSSGKPEEIIPGLITSGKSMAANIYALGLSTVQFAQKPDKSLNLGFGAKIPYSEQARQNLIGSLTFGVEPSKLLEGKITYNQNIKLSQEGQKISEANKEPSYTNVQLGLEKPTKSTEYYSGGAFLTGVMAGAMVYGLKDVVPINVKSVGKFTNAKGEEISNTFLVVGSESIGYRGLLGRTTSGWKFGGPSVERIRPEGSNIVIENPQRGTEIATPNRFATDVLSSKAYWEQVTKIGKASTPYEGELVGHAKTMNKILTTPETNIQRSTVLETQREGLSEATVKGGLTGISEKQGPLSFLNPKTGKAGKVQGSTSTEQFLPSDILTQSKSIAPAHDIDVIKANPLGILEEKQAQNLAVHTNKAIQKEQGIFPSLETVYRGLPKESLNKLVAGQIKLSETSTSSEIYTSPEASTALFFGRYNNPGESIGLARIKLTSESNILRYQEIPKSERPSSAITDWRKANPILINYAKSKGKSGLRKPVKIGGEETILFDNSLVKEVTPVPTNIRFTEVKGRRIYEGKEKAIEFVTRKDETGSSLGKSGYVYGTPIDTSTFKSTIKDTNKSVKHTSGTFQAQTNIAKIGIQTKESAKAQSATEEQLKVIGEGEIFSPELFAPKAIIRPYYQTLATSRELLKNPETKQQALKGIEAAHAMRYYRFDNPETALFKWESKPNKTVEDFLKEKQAETSTLSPTSRYSNIRSPKSIFSPSSQSKTSQFSSSSNKSSYSQSVKPSSKSSMLSSRISSSSIQSGLSKLSSKSSKSGKSSLLGKSGSSASSKSGTSKSSKPFSSSIFSGSSFSGSSASSRSGTSTSSISGESFSINNILIKPKYPGNIGIRRKPKEKEGPTAIYNLNVNNIFASGLNITVAKNRRYEF